LNIALNINFAQKLEVLIGLFHIGYIFIKKLRFFSFTKLTFIDNEERGQYIQIQIKDSITTLQLGFLFNLQMNSVHQI
jgi:hypothetical protein